MTISVRMAAKAFYRHSVLDTEYREMCLGLEPWKGIVFFWTPTFVGVTKNTEG